MSSVAQIALSLRGPVLRVEAGRCIRIQLAPGEACRITGGARFLHVLSGMAWLTQQGRDVMVRPAERVKLEWRKGDGPLLSGLGYRSLLVELIA